MARTTAMAGKDEEQQPLATRDGSSAVETHAPHAAAASSAYGAVSSQAAVVAPAAAAAEVGASGTGLGDVFGEDLELEAGHRRLLVVEENGAANTKGVRGTGKVKTKSRFISDPTLRHYSKHCCAAVVLERQHEKKKRLAHPIESNQRS